MASRVSSGPGWAACRAICDCFHANVYSLGLGSLSLASCALRKKFGSKFIAVSANEILPVLTSKIP
eukprot:8787852-Pyramimonas_sp.AAC.1